jgi:DNA-binding transcriptional regulator YdaS (Cro superfamily)
MDLSTYLESISGIELARALGVHPSLVSQWKTGRRRVSADTAVRIERATHGAVTRFDLRPEIFGPIENAAVSIPLDDAHG